jgi:hypothetical protein
MELHFIEPTVHACARSLCDQHLREDIPTIVQVLECAMLRHGEETDRIATPAELADPYVLWAAYSGTTYLMLWRFAIAMCVEYTQRFSRGGVIRSHVFEERIVRKLPIPPAALIGNVSVLRVPQSFPIEFQDANPHQGHRAYYQHLAATRPMRWTKRKAPKWFQPKVTYLDFYNRALYH